MKPGSLFRPGSLIRPTGAGSLIRRLACRPFLRWGDLDFNRSVRRRRFAQFPLSQFGRRVGVYSDRRSF